MGIFDKFNKNIDVEEIKKQKEEARNGNKSGDFPDLPEGTYEGKLERMEIKATKTGEPQFSAMLRITSGKYKKFCVFYNKKIAGTKADMWMISQVEDFVNKFEPENEIDFNGDYDNFNEQIMDAAEEICGMGVEFVLEYTDGKNGKKFSNVSINDTWDE
jgi:hypothetical protein